MQGDIVGQGIELMVYGMGTVVVFLALLVVATNTMSWLVTRYFPEPESAVATPVQKAAGAPPPDDDPQLLAAISAAIHRHRVNRK
jgi:oxaloacetate decarboxylase gamma subunit